jgi:hypothetical protein
MLLARLRRPFTAAAWPVRALSTWALWVSALVACESFVLVIAWAIATTASRESFGEGEALFEAARIRAGLPIYFDGIAGVLDYGPPPTHYYVLYTPLWPGLLSLLPAAHALAIARASATAAWLGVLALFVAMAPRGERRPAALLAVYFAGTYNLVIFATTARHDMLAVALAAIALARAMRRERVDGTAGALFALAAWVKPNVLGLASGALAAQALLAPRALVAAGAGATAVSAVCAIVLDRASQGTWFDHLVRSTAQPFTLANWLSSMQGDLVWFGAPVAFAALGGLATRRPAARLALGSLCTSTAWAILLGAKTGAGTNYWLEPAIAAVATLAASAPWPRPVPRLWPVAAAIALFQSIWVGVASNRSVFDATARSRAHRRLLDEARAECLAGGGLVLSNTTGDELDLDGRIVMPSYQFSHLVLAGRAPVDVLLGVIQDPHARCYLEHLTTDLRSVPASAAVLEHEYELRDKESEWKLWVRRSGPTAL